MLDLFIDTNIRAWREVRGYAQRLVADLSDDDMLAQPVPGVVLNHPAWILSHCALYGPLLAGMLRGEPVDDPKGHRHGFGSQPVADASEYLPKDELIDRFVAVFDDAAAALRDVTESRLAEPTPLERFRPRFPLVIDLPGQFFVKHNMTHLGQLSAWRRACGRPAV